MESGTIQEHRFIYETFNGVKLDKNTCVHHLNRDKTDNRPENLIALSLGDHNKLHAFEDRTVDMKTLIKLEEKVKQYNEMVGTGSRKSAKDMLSSLVAYGSVIYRRMESKGYVYLFPVVDGKVDYSKKIPEHNLVYEQAYGISLPKGAIVKHVNGVKSDNNIENLILADYVSVVHGKKYKTERTGTEQTSNVDGDTPLNVREMTADVLKELIQLYSNSRIASMYGVSPSTVAKWRRDFGLPSANEQHGWNRGNKPKYNADTLPVAYDI